MVMMHGEEFIIIISMHSVMNKNSFEFVINTTYEIAHIVAFCIINIFFLFGIVFVLFARFGV